MKTLRTISFAFFAVIFLWANTAFSQDAKENSVLPINEKSGPNVVRDTAAISTSDSGFTPKANPYSVSKKPAPPAAAGGDSKWHFEASPYLWAASLKGDLRVRNTTAHVESSFSDVLKQLDFAFATQFEAINGRWRLLFDENYINLGTVGTFGVGPLTRSVEVEPTLNFFESGVSYAAGIVENKNATADKPLPPILTAEVIGGVRYTHFGLGLEPQNQPAVEGSRNLVDVFFGNRVKVRPNPMLTLIGKYTVGAGSTDFAVSAAGLVDLRVHKKMSLWFGYQLLDMNADKPSNTVGFDGQMRGLIFGATMHR